MVTGHFEHTITLICFNMVTMVNVILAIYNKK